MEISVAVRLIEKGVSKDLKPQTWADLGSGNGLFTIALSALLAPASTIFAIDQDVSALQKIQLNKPDITLHKVQGDFTVKSLDLNDLDGVIMANSLHFIADKIPFVKKLRTRLKPDRHLILVEYDMDKSNQWVPYPISFSTLTHLALEAGFNEVIRMGEHPSVYHRANLYAALLTSTTA